MQEITLPGCTGEGRSGQEHEARAGRSATTSPRAEDLPTRKTPRQTALQNTTILVYGASKVGKSELLSYADGVLYLATEPGLNHLEVFQIPIRSWEEFLAACAAIEAGNHPFQIIVVDTLDNLYRLISEHVRSRLGIDHEADAGYGKGFGLVNDELHRVLTKLAFLPYGLILISHAEEREVVTRTGKVTKMVPSLPDKARRIVQALVDMILFVEIEDGPNPRRVIRTKPHPRYEAGDRTGLLPDTLDLDFPTFQTALERATNPQPKEQGR